MMKVVSLYDGVDYNFKAIIEACGKRSDSDLFPDSASLTKLLEYTGPLIELQNYLGCNGIDAQCAVIEYDYIDRDFLEDYTSYYARCFRDNSKKCRRIHFFSAKHTEADIRDALANPESKIDLAGTYLGFVVIRPLQKTIIGRTCLVSYPEKEKVKTKTGGVEYISTGRHYPATCKVSVSFFGIPLEVKCMPFQEQDQNVAACATCALWSALSVSAHLFGNVVRSPSSITALAMKNSFSEHRTFPNHGLSTEEMFYAIRKMGLEPIVVNVNDPSAIARTRRRKSDPFARGRRNMFLGNIYAYLNLGISVIAIVDRIDDDRKIGEHAVAISGYHISPEDHGVHLFAERVDKLYVNDDQRIPGSRLKIHWKEGQKGNGKNNGYLWLDISSDADNSVRRHYVPRMLIIPIYHKIRIDYEEVWNRAYECDRVLRSVAVGCINTSIQWDIALKTCSNVKGSIRKDKYFSADDKVKIAMESMPRFLWCISVSVNGRKSISVFVDATDLSGHDLNVVARLFYDTEIRDLARKACDENKVATESVLCKVFCGYEEC